MFNKSHNYNLTDKKDGYLFFNNDISEYTIYKQSLIIDGSKIRKTIDYINQNEIKSIMINSAYFNNVKDLEFLIELKNIESIAILDDGFNLSILNSMSNLRKLSFGIAKQEIDLSNFKFLKILGCDYSNKIYNLEKALNLEWIYIRNYKKENLLEFAKMVNLKFLHIYNTKIENLIGIDNLINLKDFEIEKAPLLNDLNGLSARNISIKRFCIDNAKTLTDVDKIALLVNLEELFLFKIGNIENIEFIKNLKFLKKIAIGAKINFLQKDYLKHIKEVHI